MNISEKTILITGSTDGLGKLVARRLAEKGAKVLLHGRNKTKGKSVLDELGKISTGPKPQYYNADFSSFGEVAGMAQKLLDKNVNIDILINNAAIGSGKASGNIRELSADGVELRMAVNYFSQVLLTEKILPLLKQGSNIINVASTAQARLDFNDLMLERHYDGYHAYSVSKTALIMYTFDLAERLSPDNITVNALHPSSLMNTNMVLKDWGYTLTSVEAGADAVENLLFPDRTGAYFDRKNPAKTIAQAYDPNEREKLRKATWETIGRYL